MANQTRNNIKNQRKEPAGSGVTTETKETPRSPLQTTGEHNVAHTRDAEVPDPKAPRVGKEVLTEEDAKKAS